MFRLKSAGILSAEFYLCLAEKKARDGYCCLGKQSLFVMVVVPVPVAELSTGWDCDRLLAGNAGSNPPKGLDICLF